MPGYRAKPVWPLLQSGHPLARGLVAAWPFFEGSGGSINDISGNRHTGTCPSPSFNPSWVNSPFGRAAMFPNNVNSYYSINLSWLTGPIGTPISIATWVNTPGGTNSGIIGNATSSVPRVNVHLPYSDNIVYWDYDNTAGGRISTSFAAYLNAWTFVVLTNDGVAAKAIYINGVPVASNATSNASAGGSAIINQLGESSAGGTFPYNGSVADFKIYNRVLPANEIALLYQDSFAPYRRPSRRWESVIITGPPPITGALASTEAVDAAAMAGTIASAGTLASIEATDAAAFAGTITFPAISGALAAAEATDAAAFTSALATTGALAATEAVDAAFFSSAVTNAGTLAATEAGDRAALVGSILDAITANLAATDAPDVAAIGSIIPTGAQNLNRELIFSTLFSKLTAPPMVFLFTADTAAGSVTLANVSDTSGLMIGMPLNGDGLPEHAAIATITPAVTLNVPAVADRTGSAMTQGFQTYSRRLAQPSEETDMPALYLLELAEEHLPRQSNEPGQIVLSAEAWLFSDAGEDPDAVPASALNYLLDAVQAAIDPPNKQPGGMRQNLGLSGIIYARIDGEIVKDPGHAGRIAGAIVPIKIRTAQTVLNYPVTIGV